MQLSDFFEIVNKVLSFKLFEINQTPITVSSVIIFFVFFIGLVLLSRFFSHVLAFRILARVRLDKGTRYNFKRITYYILATISAIFSFQFVGIDLSGLAVIFGLLSVGIGFGLQNITSNFISGLILLFERPIKVGDRVTVGDTLGDVIAINMRSTTIRTLQNISIIVPNSEFVSSNVINWSHRDPKIRLDVEVGVSYNSDLKLVKRALCEVATEHHKVLKSPKPEALLMEFGNSAWNMELRVWLSDPKDQFRIRSDLNSAIVHRFRDYGIEIPYPQRDLHLRNTTPIPVLNGNKEEVVKIKQLSEEVENNSTK